MEKLFGIPTNQLMVALLVIFVIGVFVMAMVAIRNPVIFKLGVRNAPRRRAQTALIVLGLMLATLLFSASFTIGDTLNNSIRSEALKQIGMVDIMVQAETPDPSGHPAYFDEAYFDTVREGLTGVPEVDGVARCQYAFGGCAVLCLDLSIAKNNRAYQGNTLDY